MEHFDKDLEPKLEPEEEPQQEFEPEPKFEPKYQILLIVQLQSLLCINCHRFYHLEKQNLYPPPAVCRQKWAKSTINMSAFSNVTPEAVPLGL